MEYSSCLENAVYIHLRRKGAENIFYYKTSSGKEVDFVVQQRNGKIQLYQVCVDINDKKTKQRELSALIETAKELKITKAFIISIDDSEIITLGNIIIHIIPYWKWAIENIIF